MDVYKVKRSALIVALVAATSLSATTSVMAQDKDAKAEEPEAPKVPTTDQEAIAKMDAAVVEYYDSQKNGAIGYLSVGGASLLVGGVLAFHDGSAVRGGGIATASLSLINLSAGAYVLSTADETKAEVRQRLKDDPIAFKEEESAHMVKKATQTRIYEVVDTVFILGGLGTAVWGHIQQEDFVRGFGLGMTAQGTANVVMHSLSLGRSGAYFDAIQSFEAVDQTGTPTKASLTGAVFGFQGSF